MPSDGMCTGPPLASGGLESEPPGGIERPAPRNYGGPVRRRRTAKPDPADAPVRDSETTDATRIPGVRNIMHEMHDASGSDGEGQVDPDFVDAPVDMRERTTVCPVYGTLDEFRRGKTFEIKPGGIMEKQDGDKTAVSRIEVLGGSVSDIPGTTNVTFHGSHIQNKAFDSETGMDTSVQLTPSKLGQKEVLYAADKVALGSLYDHAQQNYSPDDIKGMYMENTRGSDTTYHVTYDTPLHRHLVGTYGDNTEAYENTGSLVQMNGHVCVHKEALDGAIAKLGSGQEATSYVPADESITGTIRATSVAPNQDGDAPCTVYLHMNIGCVRAQPAEFFSDDEQEAVDD